MKKLAIMILMMVFSNAFAMEATHLVVFGDSLSDRGHSQYGGFNRYSNGLVWPEYIGESLCRDCVQDYAWGGARTDNGNYNGFNWSGLFWQIDQYKLNTNPYKTLYIIWAGANDLINGDASGAEAAKNINMAIDKLAAKGAKYIAVLTLPDITMVPAYNNDKLPEFKQFHPVKGAVQAQIFSFNKTLKSYAQNRGSVKVYYIDMYHFFAALNAQYKNASDPWLGTYHYPKDNDYMWWDSFHPMTSVHHEISRYLQMEFKKRGIVTS